MSPEVEITFYKEFKNHPQLGIAAASLHTASQELYKFMIAIEKTQPEYYKKLLEVRTKMGELNIELETQLRGNIAY